MLGRRQRVAECAYFAGGGALIASALLHWVRHGAGSGLRGHELIDAIVVLGRHVPALSAARLTVLWYVVPLLGAISWIALGVAGIGARVTRVVAVVALVASALVVAAFVRLAGLPNLGVGPVVAAAGALTLVAATGFARRGESRTADAPQ
jgi:hypothetical protein